MGLLGKLIRFITGQTRSWRISPKVDLNNLPPLKTFILEPIITPSGVVDSSHFSEPLFESGFFTVGAKGEVGVDYLFDGGGYEGELAIFSLKDLEQYDVSTSQGLHDFIQVVAERALSDSELGHIVISDAAEGARFSGIFPSEWHDWNAGEYQGVKTFNMHPGDTFGVMLVPNATVQELYDNPDAGGAVRPLFSMVTANPSEAFHLGQAVDVNGKATTFVLEDQRFDQGSDHDYEDIIFQFHGATGKAANMDNFVNHDVDWRGSELGQKLIEFIKPPANQPLIGIIDTGITADNPDLDPYHIHFGNHADLVAGDGNPLLQSGEGSEHGTHIAGIIAATQDNGLGIDGINDQAPLYISRATGSGNWAQGLVDFVDAAKESGQPHAIANLSLDLTQINHDGSVTTRYEFTPFEREALEYARQNHVLIVAAAGNDGDVMSVLGQASQEFDNIITTGAAKHLDLPSDHAVPIAEAYDRADYSSYGYGLDILADGGTVENPILSTVGDGLGTLAGTSVATAQVTGAASLVWAANPDLDYRQVIEILKSTATDLKTPGWDAETGSGLLNIAAAVELAKRTAPEVYNPAAFLAPTTWDGEGQVLPFERSVGTHFKGTIQSVGDVIDTGWLRIRKDPRINSAEIAKINAGTELEFDDQITTGGLVEDQSGYGSSTSWYHLADGRGWMSGLYIGNIQQIQNTPISQPSDQPSDDPGTPVVTITTPENSGSYTDPGNSSVPEPPVPTFDVPEPFYSVWQKYQGFIGSPIEDVQSHASGATYQRFDNGSIISSSYGTFALYGGVRQVYLNTGGLNGWLGAPTSAITEDPSHNGVLKQKFEHGYIIWNGNKATAYQFGNGGNKQSTPDSEPTQQVTLIRTGAPSSIKEIQKAIDDFQEKIDKNQLYLEALKKDNQACDDATISAREKINQIKSNPFWWIFSSQEVTDLERSIEIYQGQKKINTQEIERVTAENKTYQEAIDANRAILESESSAKKDWTKVDSSDRMLYVMDLLVNQYHYPVNGAAGLVGNLWAESGVLPNRIEGSKIETPMKAKDFHDKLTDFTPEQVMNRSYEDKHGPKLAGIGLAQWTFSSRRKGLFEYEFNGEQLGKNILFNMDAQVDYLAYELKNNYSAVYKTLMDSGVTLNTASDKVLNEFERPADITGNTNKRRTYAQTALNAYNKAHPKQ